MKNANPIRPIHTSVRNSNKGKIKPNNMSKAATIDNDTKDLLTMIALNIFTDCVNSGQHFQDALLAIYLSGLENGMSAYKENINDR